MWGKKALKRNSSAVEKKIAVSKNGGAIGMPAPKNRKRLYIAVGVSMVFVSLTAAFAYGWDTGNVPFSPAATSCSADRRLIDKYNQTVREQGVTKLTGIKDAVIAKGNEQDPTCVYMQLVVAYGERDYDASERAITALAEIEASGKKISDRIDDGVNRQSLEATVKVQIEDRQRGYDGQG